MIFPYSFFPGIIIRYKLTFVKQIAKDTITAVLRVDCSIVFMLSRLFINQLFNKQRTKNWTDADKYFNRPYRNIS